jgi:hypothetical protein
MTDPSDTDSAQPPAGENPQSDPQSADPAGLQPDDEATRVSCTPRYVCAASGWPARW